MTKTVKEIVAEKLADAKDYRDLADRYAQLGKKTSEEWYRAQAQRCVDEAVELKEATR